MTNDIYRHTPPTASQVEVLTKGDNNRVDDRGLYAPGQLWLQREDILGRARGTLRYLGMVTIILNDYPPVKYVLIGMCTCVVCSFSCSDCCCYCCSCSFLNTMSVV